MSDKVIYKYGPLGYTRLTEIKGRVVHIDWLEGIRVWCELDVEQENKSMYLGVVATGESYRSDNTYLGTVIDRDMGLVWHVVKVETYD